MTCLASSWTLTAAAQAQVYAIQGGKVHPLTEAPFTGTVVLQDGKIQDLGPDVATPAGAEIIDASGLEVYPGLFDSMSLLGLMEIGSVAATRDTTELGAYNPHLVAATAIHPASEHIPVARANGITHTLVAPQGGRDSVVPGQASLIHLAGWTVEEMLVEPAVGMVLNWPTMATRFFDRSTFTVRNRPFSEVKKEYDERLAEIAEWFDAARHYNQAHQALETRSGGRTLERDLKLEALARVVTGKQPLLVLASDEREIRAAVEFAADQGVEIILFASREAWKVKDLLKERGIPVVLGPTQALPQEEDEPYDRPFTLASELHQAGVRFAFATFNSSDSRTLPYEAANAVPFGLPREEALKAVTLYPAQIFGVADQLGSLEAGKVANLIVTTGDPLEITTEVRHLFIQGHETSTDNRHRRLYERYRSRP